MRLFRDVDCCVTLVLTLEEAIASDQARAREMVVETEFPGMEKFVEFAPPLKMSDFDFEPDSPHARGRSRTAEILGWRGIRPGRSMVSARPALLREAVSKGVL